MIANEIEKHYYDWICAVAIPDLEKRKRYSKLLMALYVREFMPSMAMDDNRRVDGLNFRNRFAYETNTEEYAIKQSFGNNPCSMLEMMISLASKIEEQIMSDPDQGDRTSLWFQEMLCSLGIDNQNDQNFDYKWFNFRIDIFENRDYEANGKFGLFTIKHPLVDMRTIEIWYQMSFYLNEIT